MPFDARRYLSEHRIPYSTEGKNVSPGWIGIRCPLCGDKSDHGGFAPDGRYSCWRCGAHQAEEVIQALEGLLYHEACRRVQEYQHQYHFAPPRQAGKTYASLVTLPSGARPLTPHHERYLIKRGYNPQQIAEKYGVLGTGPIGPYCWRLIIPIYFNQQLVSYQTRDITGRSPLRYKACPAEQEVIPHKEILYNLDHCTRDQVIVVEGITDTWRFGDDCAATFGIKFKTQPVQLLAQRFKTIYVLFDAELIAQKQADKLANTLHLLGRKAYVINLTNATDPGELSQVQAEIMKGELFNGL